MIKLLHFSDIHLGSGFTHGKINPQTGLNTRFEDFVSTMGRCVDRAISEQVDRPLSSCYFDRCLHSKIASVLTLSQS